MSPVEILVVAVGLAMDAFAVALGAGGGLPDRGRGVLFRLAFHFGLFQSLMALAGWFAGARVVGILDHVDHWLAFGLLAFVGGRMVAAGLRQDNEGRRNDPSRGWTLVLLSVATSIDALAVGFSLALLKVQIWLPALVIGIVCAALSASGVRLGRELGPLVDKRMELVGGLVLIAVGVRILFAHGVL